MQVSRLVLVGVPMLLSLVLLTVPSPADDPNRFLQVKEWAGTFTAEYKASYTGPEYKSGPYVFRDQATTRWFMNGSVKLQMEGRGVPQPLWNGEGTATSTVDEEGTSGAYRGSHKGSAPTTLTDLSKGGAPRLQIFSEASTYYVSFGSPRINVDQVFTVTTSSPPSTQRRAAEAGLTILSGGIPLPEKGLRLTQRWEMPAFESSSFKSLQVGFVPWVNPGITNDVIWSVLRRQQPSPKAKITWDLAPVTERLEVVVDPEDYENWIPTGGRPGRPG